MKTLVMVLALAIGAPAVAGLDTCYMGSWQIVKPTAINGESSLAGLVIEIKSDGQFIGYWYDNNAATKQPIWSLGHGSHQARARVDVPVAEMDLYRTRNVSEIWEPHDAEKHLVGVANLYHVADNVDRLDLWWSMDIGLDGLDCIGECEGNFELERITYMIEGVACRPPGAP